MNKNIEKILSIIDNNKEVPATTKDLLVDLYHETNKKNMLNIMSNIWNTIFHQEDMSEIAFFISPILAYSMEYKNSCFMETISYINIIEYNRVKFNIHISKDKLYLYEKGLCLVMKKNLQNNFIKKK
ncbi:hypothetical protein [Hugenholtzia roseola]|uniref:hypothetical protein n=1 Tax=Hugenholtzia roseola TaxID=1002 RepID=UPI00047EB842|nr:hypothetical protein [Hugenholtzia roseola]